jgi:hypothetical protein
MRAIGVSHMELGIEAVRSRIGLVTDDLGSGSHHSWLR